MAQHGFNQFGGGPGGGSIDPNDLAMAGAYNSGFQNNMNNSNNNGSHAFSSGSALFGDDELLDGLGDGQSGIQGRRQEFGNMNEMNMGYPQGMYNSSHQGMQSHVDGFSNTPEGDPIQSPFVHNFSQYRQMHHPQSFGTSLQSPASYATSPLANDMNNEGDSNYLNAKARARMSQAMQRKTSNTRSPLTAKTAATAMANLSMDSQSYGAQPIRGAQQEKSQAGQWMQTPSSLTSLPGSGFSSPLQPGGLHSAQINEMLLKGGTSMPAKLSGAPGMTASQEAKRKRRRESHNLVERRRRDNINERIQDLSKLVPAHRLEDERIKKLIQNGTSLSPTLTGVSSPSQATSGLAGPGARRATGGAAGNITTGLPVEDKDKGPNKGDILNGAVSWTRDLMWLLNVKLSQQEELMNTIIELGGQIPFEITEDERRMRSELDEAMGKNETTDPQSKFTYSRYAGSGLRVPHHTDYKGDPLDGAEQGGLEGIVSISPDANGAVGGLAGGDLVDQAQFWGDDDDEAGDIDFKEEREYGMDLTT